MISERSLQVLHAIVTDYVATNEPVGSKRIVQQHPFGVSAATIRNDMMALEEAELITAPHTSSGRVPTDKGYRLYVDTLARLQPLSRAKRAAIEQFLGDAHDLEEMLSRTVRLLAQLTNQVALIQYPAGAAQTVHHFDLVALSDTRVLSVLITSNGLLSQNLILLTEPLHNLETAVVLRELIGAVVVGQSMAEASAQLQRRESRLFAMLADPLRETARAVSAAVQEQLSAVTATKLKVAGAANISHAGVDELPAATVLEALEEQVALLQLFNEFKAQGRHSVTASIGSENESYGLERAAVIAAEYGAGTESSAKLGVLGPVRMDYAANIAAVRAVASYLNKLLGTN